MSYCLVSQCPDHLLEKKNAYTGSRPYLFLTLSYQQVHRKLGGDTARTDEQN